MQTDPIADMLTRIRNALRIRAQSCTLPGSALKVSVLDVLKREGYIEGYEVHAVPGKHDGKEAGATEPEGQRPAAKESAGGAAAKSAITVKLKYGPDGEDVITKLVRISTPGCRRYRRVEKLPRPRAGLGISIVSTSQGVLSDRECRQKRAGGEVLCTIE